jgi:protein-disulfide isomerase
MKKTSTIITIGVIAVVILLGYLAYISFAPKQILEIGNGVNPPLGNPQANITIIEFSDFQCPACAMGEPVIESLLQEYDGKIAVYYRNYPLISIHENAFIASQAAQAANEQGRFWEYHDLLFENQNNLDKESLQGYAEQLGLNMTEFNRAFDGKFDSQINQDIADADKIGIRGTPSFYINGKVVGGANEEKIKQYIEEALNNNQ